MHLEMPAHLRPHHRETVEKLVRQFSSDDRYIALIVGGSVAKGTAREDSDVDVVAVLTDQEYARCRQQGQQWFFDNQTTTYPGGYVDGKLVDLTFLRDVASHGSEVARSAFVGAFPAYSHSDEVLELLRRIPVYPEHEREAKLRAFISQVYVLNWYIGEAEKRQDRYLLTRMTAELALFACRAILAHNRILYPYHKWLMHRVAEAAEKPANFVARIDALLETPTAATAKALCDSLLGWRDWGTSHFEAVGQFILDTEWNWREHRAPLCDW